MEAKQRSYKAHVKMSIVIEVEGHWGDNCTIKQVEDQAKENAFNGLDNTIQAASKTKSAYGIIKFSKLTINEVLATTITPRN